MYSQAATQNLFITHFNLSINQVEVGQSNNKSGSHSVSHFMFSHCQSVSYFMFSICQSVSQSVILCSVTVSQSVSHLCSVIVSQWVSYFMFSHSVSQWVIYVPHHLSVSQSVSHLCSSSSVCQWVSESFMFFVCLSVSQWVILCSVSFSQWVILCSVSVSQSVSHFMFSICLSVSQSVILCSVSLSQSVSQLVNYLIRQKDRKKLTDQQINQIRQTKRHTDKKMVFCPSVSHLVLKKRQASLTKHHF